jgi:hypothetical protein
MLSSESQVRFEFSAAHTRPFESMLILATRTLFTSALGL